MKRQTIQRKFKGIDKTDINQLIATACNIIREHHVKHGIGITDDYYQRGLGWKLQQDILNRQYFEKPYSLAVDYVESITFDLEAKVKSFN